MKKCIKELWIVGKSVTNSIYSLEKMYQTTQMTLDAEQVKQPACNFPHLAHAVLALFPECQVRLLYVKELCLGTVKPQSPAQFSHRRIVLLYPFPQQFRTAESRVHLQEHQGHFPFRREERFASQLRPHAFPYQTEAICHLAEMEQLLYPAQFALFES